MYHLISFMRKPGYSTQQNNNMYGYNIFNQQNAYGDIKLDHGWSLPNELLRDMCSDARAEKTAISIP